MSIHEWNNKVLAAKGIKHKAIAPKVVRSVGDAKRATLYDGTVAERKDAIFVDGYGLVKCINSSLHFVYETPKHMKGWKYYCTCGSISGVVGYAAYSKLASPTDTGMILACVRMLAMKQSTGFATHADGSTE